jgi:hypothetical protein
MIDTDTADLLAAIRDALQVPPAATEWGQRRRAGVLNARADAVRRAVDHAASTGDLARATDMVDEAMHEHPASYVCTCDIAELPDLAALKAWAAGCGVGVDYAGPDAQHRPVYRAKCGVVTRVARGSGRDPAPIPVVWESPLERPDAEASS